jgi:hypothetical protein
MKLGLTMRKASIDAHVKRIWNPEEDISLLVLSPLPDPQLLESNPSAKKEKKNT